MSRNAKWVVLAVIAAVVVVVVFFIARDIFLGRHAPFDCGDGPRRTIDIRDFTTQYSAYSLELEASVADKARISTKVNPIQLQQLSEAIQNARDFRQYVVAGYNSCAVTKAQYAQYGARFQALDNLAREINQLTASPSSSQGEMAKLGALISQYGQLARKQGTQ